MEFSRNAFIKRAEKNGKSSEYIEAALSYADKLTLNDLPVIFSLVHLSILSEVDYKELKRILDEPNLYYKTYQIKKRRGGYREIHSPFRPLYKLQSFIHQSILSNVPVSECAFAYVKGRSIVDNAKVHIGQPYIRTFDIKGFFPAISIGTVRAIFNSLGYIGNLSIDLSKFCTASLNIPDNGRSFLPQGAPTSPIISNIVMRDFDNRMSNFAVQNDLKYSRYADDFTFSGEKEFLPKVSFVKRVLSSEGFELNTKKTRTYNPNSTKRIVTGLLVSEDSVRIPPKFKKEVFQHMYYLKKFGPQSHIEYLNEKRGFQLKFYQEWLLGKLMFINMVEPELGKTLISEFNSFDWGFK